MAKPPCRVPSHRPVPGAAGPIACLRLADPDPAQELGDAPQRARPAEQLPSTRTRRTASPSGGYTTTGIAEATVRLQYRPKDSTTYTTVKGLTTNSTGKLNTTVKATADGFYRFAFTGTSTTPAATATGDYIDVV